MEKTTKKLLIITSITLTTGLLPVTSLAQKITVTTPKVFYQYIINKFAANLVPVQVNDKTGYIDRTGKTVIKPQFDMALNFSEGLAYVRSDNKSGYMDKYRKYIWSVEN